MHSEYNRTTTGTAHPISRARSLKRIYDEDSRDKVTYEYPGSSLWLQYVERMPRAESVEFRLCHCTTTALLTLTVSLSFTLVKARQCQGVSQCDVMSIQGQQKHWYVNQCKVTTVNVMIVLRLMNNALHDNATPAFYLVMIISSHFFNLMMCELKLKSLFFANYMSSWFFMCCFLLSSLHISIAVSYGFLSVLVSVVCAIFDLLP